MNLRNWKIGQKPAALAGQATTLQHPMRFFAIGASTRPSAPAASRSPMAATPAPVHAQIATTGAVPAQLSRGEPLPTHDEAKFQRF